MEKLEDEILAAKIKSRFDDNVYSDNDMTGNTMCRIHVHKRKKGTNLLYCEAIHFNSYFR